jgi:hypothetical protein
MSSSKAVVSREWNFAPTHASEHLSARGLLLEAALWQRRRRRDCHRTRRERRACRGELVQMDASVH